MPAGLDGNPDPIVSDARTAVIDLVTGLVWEQKRPEIPLLVAIDGIDGSGKSTFADELAASLSPEDGSIRATIVRASIDSFHNPRAVRHERGRGSGSGFYFDSHNLSELSTRLLDPFRRRLGGDYRTACFDEPSDSPVDPPSATLTGDEILIFDGIFLCRPELFGSWDYVIHLDGRARVDAGRGERYTTGMAIYFDAEHPIERADLVIDNNDLANPTVVANRGSRDGISQRLASYYNLEAETRAGRGVDPQRTSWRQRFIDLLAEESRTELIELGSGPGRDTLALGAAGLSVVAVDLSLEAMKLLGNEGVAAINGSLYELPFGDAAFDGAWTMSTLMHIPDARFGDAMAEICRVLRPGAPIGIGLWGGLDSEGIRQLDTIDPPRFFSFRSHDRTRAMLAAHGELELFETKDYGTPDGSIYQFAILRVG